MKCWTPIKLWNGSTCVIIGGGPSFTNEQADLIKESGLRVIGCNDAYKLGDWIDICYFGDQGWYDKHWKDEVHPKTDPPFPGLKKFKNLIITCCYQAKVDERVLKIEQSPKGFKKPHLIGWYFNTGASAINLAYMLGVKKVILVGFDFHQDEDGNNNWHENICHPHQNDGIYRKWNKWFTLLVADIKRSKSGMRVFNASPGTQLEHFPTVDLKEILKSV